MNSHKIPPTEGSGILPGAPEEQAKATSHVDLRHALRTPLHSLTGILEVLDGTELNEQQKSFLAMAQASTDTLTKAVDQLLGTPERQAVHLAEHEPQEQEDRQSEAAASLITRFSPREARCTLRILVAEDNPIHRALAATTLKRQGFEVTTARNGKEALHILQTEGCDLILLDLSMPEMGGLEAAARIRKAEEETGRQLLIVMLTAHASEHEMARCLDAGANGYVTKPIRPSQLCEVISGVFEDRGGR